MSADAARLRDAMSDLEYLFLEQGLKGDAAYIATLMTRGPEAQAAATKYIHESNYLDRMNAWKQARR